MQPLQNVLSISTAGRNRYLLHFNSLHSLTQWTAGIRLAMFEHSSLQELYTGSLIAGKGKSLNSIKSIMDRSRFKTEDWVRVRFGAGTPWRRCWCVISPPDEKDFQKVQKQMRKKSAYNRSFPTLKGDIKFYDVKKTKKTLPIATITDAYSAYAIYPQSKPLIDQSTLVKVEGTITIHSSPASTSEGFVFVMPEVHPAVSGFEIMLRWLFPVFDTFALYGRPTRLIADTLDTRGIMFAMPTDRRYGYLEILDVAGLIHTDGSNRWKEAEWRKHMKEVTSKRMKALNAAGSRQGSRNGTRRSTRTSLNLPSRSTITFDENASTRSSPIRQHFPRMEDGQDSSPPAESGFAAPPGAPYGSANHQRSVSEAQGLDRYNITANPPSDLAPPPPPHLVEMGGSEAVSHANSASEISELGNESSNSDPDPSLRPADLAPADLAAAERPVTEEPAPVAAPPPFARRTSTKAMPRPLQSPELRRANSRMSTATLSQLAGASGIAVAGAAAAWKSNSSNLRTAEARTQSPPRGLEDGSDVDRGLYMGQSGASPPVDDRDQRGVMTADRTAGATANHSDREGSSAPTMNPRHPLPRPPHESSGPSEQPIVPVAPHVRTSMSRAITRKPLPSQPPPSSTDEDRHDSLRDHVYQPEALDQVLARRSTEGSLTDDPRLRRHPTTSSSVYDSDDTPDYASTRYSSETKRSVTSVERPRAGVMRTVGTVEPIRKEVVVGDIRYQPDAPPPAGDRAAIPNIDFGPTYDLTSAPRHRPGSASTVTQPMDGSGRTEPPLQPSAPIKRTSASPSRADASPSRGMMRPPTDHGRTGSSGSETEARRSMAWSPGLAASGVEAGAHASRRSLTPEQFVQQRAQQARVTPVYAHQRRPSSQTLRSATPPMTRHSSGDRSPVAPSRTPPAEHYSRPHSRGGSAAYMTNGSSPGEYAAHLSAREQEHVARVTGAPLLHVAGGTGSRARPPSVGLVGAIEAREREKKEIRDGVSGQMVQHAIMQRRQQEAQAMPYGPAYQGGAVYGQPHGPYQQQQQQQQQWDPSNGHLAAAWSSPAVGNPNQVQFQQPYPQQYQQQQQQQQQPRVSYYGHGQQNRNSQGYQ